jgi:hypothetical protein
MLEEEGGQQRFLTRVSLFHDLRRSPGIPNFWRSVYEAPDGELKIQFYRSGTPVSASLRTESSDGSFGDLSKVRLHSETAATNVGLIRKAISKWPSGSMFGGSMPNGLQRMIISIDLQSPKGIPVEVPITAMQRRVSFGCLEYLNIPVYARNFGQADLWGLPSESDRTISDIITAARARIQPGTPYAAPSHELVADTEWLLERHRVGMSTPATRYALVARVGLLTLLAGYDLHINCRSGKDRTGLVDTEIKFAAYQLWRRSQGLAISRPGCAVLADEHEAWRLLLLRSGNREIQHVNAGAPGNRVTTKHLQERIGAEYWNEYIGEAASVED